MLQKTLLKAVRSARSVAPVQRKSVRKYTAATPTPGSPEYYRWIGRIGARNVGYNEDDSWRFAPEQSHELKPDPRAATANAKARVLIDSGKLVEAGQLLSAFTQENPEVLDHITVGLIAEIKYLMQAKVKSNPQWREQTEKEFFDPIWEKEFQLTPETFNEAMNYVISQSRWELGKSYVEKAIRDKIFPDWQGVTYLYKYYQATSDATKALEALKELKASGFIDPISFEKGIKAIEAK